MLSFYLMQRADVNKQQQHQGDKDGETAGEQASSSYVTSSAPFHNLLFNFIDSRASSMSKFTEQLRMRLARVFYSYFLIFGSLTLCFR